MWEIKLNWDECPYLNTIHVKRRKYQEECGHIGNDGQECKSKNCPIKVLK